MGTSLCKERDNPNRNSISPVDRVIGRCVQICPQSLGKKKHFWDKQVLETSPTLNQQPKSNHSEWQVATLSVPDSPTDSTHPVAPPRKKKTSKLQEIVNKSSIEIPPDQNCNNTLSAPEMNSIKDNLTKGSNSDNYQNLSISISDNEGATILDVFKTTEKLNDSSLESTSTKLLPLINDSPKTDNKKNDKFPIEDQSNEFLFNLNKTTEDNSLKNKIETPEIIKEEQTNNKNTNSVQLEGEVEGKVEEIKIKDSDMNTENLPDTKKFEDKNIITNIESIDGKDEVDNIQYHQKDQHQMDLLEKNNEYAKKIMENDEEMIRKINKETGDLMFAIEKEINKNNPIVYENRESIEEEIIVPVKRIVRHICDDETHLREILPKYEPIIAPKKPQRDFSKYKKTLESMKSETSQSDISNENISNDIHENISLKDQLDDDLTSETETIPADDIEKDLQNKISKKETIDENKLPINKRRSESIPSNMMNSEKILRRCLSTQSYLTPDLIEKIAAQANNLSMSQGYLPEDFACLSNDGSNLVSPNSKLHEKKRSNSQISNNEQLKLDNITDFKENPIQENKLQQQKIIDEIINKSNSNEGNILNLNIESNIQEKINNQQSEIINDKNNDEKFDKIIKTPKRRMSANAFEKTQREISDAIQSFLGKEDLTPKNILKLLEEEFGELLNSQRLPPEDKELIEQLRKSATICQSKPTTPIQDKNIEIDIKQTEITKEVKDETNKLRKEVNETIQIENEIPLNLTKVQNKILDGVITGEKRRHSIDDLDSWFSSNLSKNDDNRETKRKREISLPDCLDPPISNNQNIEINEPIDKQESIKLINNSTTNDHSSLLRFLENEKINYY